MRSVVSAEVGYDFGNLTLKLDVERLNDIEPPPIGLPGYNPVDVGVAVHTDSNRSDRIDISIRIAGGERRGKQIRPK